MNTIQIKKINGRVIFEHTSDKNSIKNTVLEAIKEGADLRNAYLGGANLRNADLGGANLRNANLGGADLRNAYLGGADLRNAYLRGADLGGAYLGGANLGGAYLRNAYLRGAYLEGANLEGSDLEGAEKVPIYCKWNHGITNGEIHIGCEKRTIEEWDKFFLSDSEIETKRGTNEFKQIEAVYLAYRAYLTHLNK